MRFRGIKVSRPWRRVLEEAAKHVNFTLNDGRRTLADQRARIRKHGLWSPANPHGAAPAVPWAPHIKWGRANHALDVEPSDGGQQRLAAYLARHGVHVVFNVPPEPWHMDPVNGRELVRFYRRLRAQDRRRR
jgi:hypothetical protein